VLDAAAASSASGVARPGTDSRASFARPCPFESQQIVGRSPATLDALNTALQAAASDATVLITGESGTGKEVLAGLIHRYSHRADRPFVAFNCAAVPDSLLESELFGHVKGAYTGAERMRQGRFERASGGTLFLDEIGDMSLPLQGKILRALEEGEIEPMGGDRTVSLDVRVVAATHRNLQQSIGSKEFREDLYFRLAVVTIHLPPLRNRPEDVAALSEHFLTRYACQYSLPCPTISASALDVLERYSWPGNVRELRNVMERVIVLWGDQTEIGAQHLPPELAGCEDDTAGLQPGPQARQGLLTLSELELRHIRRVLAATNGHLTEAADVLGIHRNTLRRKLREHGLR
jgi:two-component system response regulator HydG